VALLARNRERLQALEKELRAAGGDVAAFPADVCEPAQVAAAVTDALMQFGRVDVLVNNAGKGLTSSVADTALTEYRDIFETNYLGAITVLQAVLPAMQARGSGTIVMISSVNGFCAVPLGSAYCASKFAMEALAESLRIELRPAGLHVLVVRPGATDTEFFDNAKRFRELNPFPLRHLMSAAAVARHTLRAVRQRRRAITLTAEGKLLWWLKKFSPALVDRILAAYVRARPAASASAEPT
jgi:short-subunit dehydrogenase